MSEMNNDTSANTSVVANAAPVNNGTTAPTSQPVTQTGVWYDGYEPDTKEYISKKGWQDPSEAIKSYRNLEKLMGGSKSVLERPNMDDPKSVEKFYGALRPESHEKYDLPIPDGTDPKSLEWYKKVAYENGLTVQQAKNIYEQHNSVISAQQQAQNEAYERTTTEEIEGLKKEYGAAFEQTISKAKMAYTAIGLNEESIAYIEKQLGPTIAIELAKNLAAGMKEDKFVGSDTATNSFGHLTPDQAKAKIKEKLSDPHFLAIYQGRNGEEQQRAVKEIERLNAYAVGI